ncbi:hypothetical protein FBU30_003947 [Linnemannia zychae]|nr:hypothetical protein FBU30_003947 [Linnemannia zychae]
MLFGWQMSECAVASAVCSSDGYSFGCLISNLFDQHHVFNPDAATARAPFMAEKTTAKEHVSFQIFVKNLDLNDRDLATKEYEELIESEKISRGGQNRSFVHFHKYFKERFWTKRALEVRNEEITDRAGFNVQSDVDIS